MCSEVRWFHRATLISNKCSAWLHKCSAHMCNNVLMTNPSLGINLGDPWDLFWRQISLIELLYGGMNGNYRSLHNNEFRQHGERARGQDPHHLRWIVLVTLSLDSGQGGRTHLIPPLPPFVTGRRHATTVIACGDSMPRLTGCIDELDFGSKMAG